MVYAARNNLIRENTNIIKNRKTSFLSATKDICLEKWGEPSLCLVPRTHSK